MEKIKLSDNYSEKQTYETIIFIKDTKDHEKMQHAGRLNKMSGG